MMDLYEIVLRMYRKLVRNGVAQVHVANNWMDFVRGVPDLTNVETFCVRHHVFVSVELYYSGGGAHRATVMMAGAPDAPLLTRRVGARNWEQINIPEAHAEQDELEQLWNRLAAQRGFINPNGERQ